MPFISGNKKKTFFGYLAVSVSLLVFSGIYELFSHSVYSPFMLLAFLIPLLGSVALFLPVRPSPWARTFYRSSLSIFTVYFLVKGVLEIYGTTSFLTVVYPVIGSLFFVFSILSLPAGNEK